MTLPEASEGNPYVIEVIGAFGMVETHEVIGKFDKYDFGDGEFEGLFVPLWEVNNDGETKILCAIFNVKTNEVYIKTGDDWFLSTTYNVYDCHKNWDENVVTGDFYFN